jgi:hypothetical protein
MKLHVRDMTYHAEEGRKLGRQLGVWRIHGGENVK